MKTHRWTVKETEDLIEYAEVTVGETPKEILTDIEVFKSKIAVHNHMLDALVDLTLACKAQHDDYYNKELSTLTYGLIECTEKLMEDIVAHKEVIKLYTSVFCEEK